MFQRFKLRCLPTQIVLCLQWCRIGFYGLWVHEPASLTRNYGTRILPSQLVAWLGPTSESLTPTGLLGRTGQPISLSCADPARRSKTVSVQQQPATFQGADWFSIGPECTATSAPPRLASLQTSASQSSISMLWPATSWLERGVRLADVRHQPQGKTAIINCHYWLSHNNAGSANRNYWQFPQDTLNGDEVENWFLVVELV